MAVPDGNQEDKGFPGRYRSRKLLLEAATFNQKTTKPTPFHSRIAQLVELAIDDSKRAGIIDRLARSGADPRAAADSWISYFPNLGDDPQFEAVRKAVLEYMNYSIIKSYGRREGQKEDEARAKFKNIPEDMRKRFGGITSSSSGKVEDYFGECGGRLHEVQKVQLTIFRQLVQLRLSDMLMGSSEDAIVARSGKLGYAWDYFDGMVIELEKFLKLMDDVKHERDRIKPELKLYGRIEQAKRTLQSTAGKKILWFFEDPRVKSAEIEYLQAEQRMMELRREDIVHSFVFDSAKKMKDICAETRDAIQRWIWHLATGDEPSGLPGLWETVRDSLKQVSDAHSFDTRVNKVQKVVAEDVKDVEESDLRKALSHWEWVIELEGDMIKPLIKARILPFEETGGIPRELENPALQSTLELRKDANRMNQNALMGLASKKFSGLVDEIRVADVIKSQYPNDPAKFVAEVASVNAEPLFEGAPGAAPSRMSDLIRVMSDPNDKYFTSGDGVQGELRNMHNLDRNTLNDNLPDSRLSVLRIRIN